MSICPFCHATLIDAGPPAEYCPHCQRSLTPTFQLPDSANSDVSPDWELSVDTDNLTDAEPADALTNPHLDLTLDAGDLTDGDPDNGLTGSGSELLLDAGDSTHGDPANALTNPNLDMTIDVSDMIAADPAAALTSPNLDLTIDAGSSALFGAVHRAAAAGSPTPPSTPSGKKGPGGTEHDRRFINATIDVDVVQGADAELSRMWDSRLSSDMSIRTSIKTSNPGSPRDSKLVINTRALSNLNEVRSRASDYELLESIGEGGMGVVYSARQASIDRTVAVKMLKPEIAKNRDQRDKFLSEAVVTGDLDHPNIVPIYDVGSNEAGALFYSMKRVEGTPWAKVLSQKSLAENLDILMKVADAVGFAHARGVIHRDIKPENVMLGEFGEVLVMDWGLALSTAAFRKAASITQSSSMGGTPAYMAPEMAAGPLERIGAGSDIYLLGAVLYEIITGKPPHTAATVMKCLFAAAKNEIQPTEYSGELLSIARRAMATKITGRYASVRAFQTAIREYQSHADSIVLSTRAEADLAAAESAGDYRLFARVLFAFEEALSLWDRNERARSGLATARMAYARQALSKNDFDLGLSLLSAENPDHAKLRQELQAAQKERDARQQRLKNVKRIAAGLAAAMALVVTGAFIMISIDRNRAVLAEGQATTERDKAVQSESRAHDAEKQARSSEQQARKSEQEAKNSAVKAALAAKQARTAEGVARKAETQARDAETQARKSERQARRDRDLAQQAKDAEEYEAYVARIGQINAKIDENAFDKALELLAECKTGFRHWEWARLKYLCGQSVRTMDAKAPIDAVALVPGDKQFVSGSWDGQVRLWDLKSGQIVRTFPYTGLYVHGVAVSPDGRLVAAVGNDRKAYIKIWNLQTGELQQRFDGHTDSVLSVAFSRDSKKLLTSSYDKAARLWDVASGRTLQTFLGHTWWIWSATFSPDEKKIVTASQDGRAIVWNVANGEPSPPFTGHTGPVYSAIFSPDGRTIASAGYDKRVLVWEPDRVQQFDFDKVFSNEPNPPLSNRILTGHSAAVRCVRFSADGRLLVSGGHDNTLRIWDVATGRTLKILRGHAGWVHGLALSTASDAVLSGSFDHLAKWWNIEGYEEERVLQARLLEGHSDAVLAAHFAPDGKSIVTASRDRTAKTWDMASGRELRTFAEGHEFLTANGIFFPDGKHLLTAAADNTVRIWDVQTGTQSLRLDHTGRSAAAAISAAGDFVVTGSDNKQARLWNAKTGELVRSLGAFRADVTAVACSPDGRLVMAADAAGHGQLFDLASGQMIHSIEGHAGRIVAAAFLPGNKRLLTASSDKTVAQWDVQTGREIPAHGLKHPDALTALTVLPDAKHAVTLCDDGLVRLWDLEQASLVRALNTRGQRCDALSVSADGQRLLTVNSHDRLVRQWDLNSGRALPGSARDGAVVEMKTGLIWSVAYAPEGQYLLTVGGNSAWMWELASGRPGISFSPHGAVASANFSPDGKRLVTASWDNSAKIWDVASGSAVAKLEGGHQGYVNCAVFSPDGGLVLTASDDHSAKLWQAAAVVGTLEGHQDRVRSVACSTDGVWAVTASTDKTARIWDIKSRTPKKVLRGHVWGLLSAAFSTKGDRVITGSEDNTARIWDVKTGKTLVELKGHTAGVNCVAFSPDGRRALTASQDNTAKLWDASTGKEMLTLRAHSQEVTAAEFSPDGQYVLTGSRDGTAIIWLAVDWKQVDKEPEPDFEHKAAKKPLETAAK